MTIGDLIHEQNVEEQLVLVNEDGSLNVEALPADHSATASNAISEALAIQAFLEEWKSDIAKISAGLNDEANDREWCTEYEQIIDRINEGLFFKLNSRRTNYRVSASGTGQATLTVTFNTELPIHYYEIDDRDFVRNHLRSLTYGGVPTNLENFEIVEIVETNLRTVDNVDYYEIENEEI